jgi:hypothetical protein
LTGATEVTPVTFASSGLGYERSAAASVSLAAFFFFLFKAFV